MSLTLFSSFNRSEIKNFAHTRKTHCRTYKQRLWFWGSRSIFVDKQFISKHERILAESACSIDLHYRFRGNILKSVQYLNFSFVNIQTKDLSMFLANNFNHHLWYRGSPTYTKITNTVSITTVFGLCTCKWGI